MKKHILTIAVLFSAIALAVGIGGLSHGANDRIEASASVSPMETEVISTEAPSDLTELRNAGSGQLDYWAGALPRFDGRELGYITEEKNQGGLGICWAYAAIGAMEANILRDGIDPDVDRDSLDLDELIAAYVRFNRSGENDPLNLTGNDTYSSDKWRTQGGHADDAFMAMSQGFSPDAQSTTEGYRDWAIEQKIAPSKYFVRGFRPVENSREAIKRAILEYGSVTMEYKAPQTTTQTYLYHSDGTSLGHASLIVGWDDGIAKNNFWPGHPTSDGAWIVKNSWGPGGNLNNGTYCFYLSYDSYLSDNLYAVDMELEKNYQNVYYYDGQIANNDVRYYTNAHGAIYEAKLSSATEQEQLTAVFLGVRNERLSANIKIYKNLKVNPGNVNDPVNMPDAGTLVAQKEGVYFEHPGFYTVDLDRPVDLEQGEYFSIVISGTDERGDPLYPVYAADYGESVNDMTYRKYNGVWTSFKGSAGDYADRSPGISVRLRAITNTVPRSVPLGNDLKYARVEFASRLIYYRKDATPSPTITVYFGDSILREGTDYTVALTTDQRPGSATVTITGRNGYYGSRVTTYEIAKPQYPPGAITETIVVYSDTTYLHEISLPAGWKWLDDDYKLEMGMSSFRHAMTYLGDDKDCYRYVSCSVNINKLNENPPDRTDLSEADASIKGNYFYTGSPIVPAVQVLLNGLPLREGRDFSVTCSGNINAGEAEATVTGTGRYFGTIRLTFQIGKAERPKQVPKAVITVSRKTKTLRDVPLDCAGWEWRDPELAIGEQTIATALYRGQDMANYQTTEMQIEVKKEAPKDISAIGELSLAVTRFVYDGEEKTPEVIARDEGTELFLGSDFTVSYRENRDAGEGFATVTGINDYTGSAELPFTIQRAERTALALFQEGWTFGDEAPASPILSGECEEAEVTYLYAAEDGGFSAELPRDAGDYRIKACVAGSQNYEPAECTARFTIAPRDIKDFTLELECDELVCTGERLEPEVSVHGGGTELVRSVDYTVGYTDNVGVGIATVEVRGRGNYTGSLSATFSIVAAEQPPTEQPAQPNEPPRSLLVPLLAASAAIVAVAGVCAAVAVKRRRK